MMKIMPQLPFLQSAVFIQVFHERLPLYDVNETLGLAKTAGYEVLSRVHQTLHHLNPVSFLGKGKVQQILDVLQAHFDPVEHHEIWKDIDLYQDFYDESEQLPLLDLNLPESLAHPKDLTFIFNNRLNYSQKQNLQGIWGTKVLDRDDLVLQIFEQNARNRKSKLQIEKARLILQTNIIKREYGLHLEEKQGRGFMGKGISGWEPQMRAFRTRMAKIDTELAEIAKHRQIQRKKRSQFFNIGIIGYTNAGKSTLLNSLAKTEFETANAEFTTVSTRARKVIFPKYDKFGNWQGEEVIFIDSVGFISDMSPILKEAFLSTLEELVFSNMLVIVLDIAEPEFSRVLVKLNTTIQIIEELEAHNLPIIIGLNKIDDISADDLVTRQRYLQDNYPMYIFIPLSAATKENFDEFKNLILRLKHQIHSPPKTPRWHKYLERET